MREPVQMIVSVIKIQLEVVQGSDTHGYKSVDWIGVRTKLRARENKSTHAKMIR